MKLKHQTETKTTIKETIKTKMEANYINKEKLKTHVITLLITYIISTKIIIYSVPTIGKLLIILSAIGMYIVSTAGLKDADCEEQNDFNVLCYGSVTLIGIMLAA